MINYYSFSQRQNPESFLNHKVKKNESLKQLVQAKKVLKKINSKIEVTISNDPRSYRQNSDKLLATGFMQKFNIEDAIDEIIQKFKSGELKDEEIFYNIKMMKKLF